MATIVSLAVVQGYSCSTSNCVKGSVSFFLYYIIKVRTVGFLLEDLK